MKITKILPRRLAVAYQVHDLTRVDGQLQYYRSMVRLYERLSAEGHEELRRLQEKRG